MNVQEEISRLIADPEPGLHTEQRLLELLGILAEIDRKVEAVQELLNHVRNHVYGA